MGFAKSIVVGLFIGAANHAAAANVDGRATVGGYFAKERFSGTSADNATNDKAVVSARGFLDVSSIGENDLRLVLDVRDKNDFFDKLDKERLELNSKNSVQLRQLYLQSPESSGKVFWTLVRFPAFDSGIVYADGA